MSSPQVGDRINNYILEALIGNGSFGQVWRGRHHVFDTVVAIKVPTDPQYVRNLQREGVAVHGLQHPNIVRALDLDPYGDPPYLVMEYVDGPSLRQVVDANPKGMPPDTAVEIMRGILSALDASHKAGLIHRDVKPANILLGHPADKLESIDFTKVKVTDFGLGRAGGLTTSSIMQSGSMLTSEGKSISGTLAYMSPEQRKGEEVDGRTDLYACGIVLFEMLVGERPSGSELPSSVREDVPGYLDDAFRRSYARLDRRFSSAAEMLKALAPAARQAGPPPVPGPATGSRCPACQRPVHADDHFCIHCGRQLVAVVPRCPSCRAFVNRKDRYCIFCGAKLAPA